MNKTIENAAAAVADIQDGATLMLGGFGYQLRLQLHFLSFYSFVVVFF